MRSINAASQVGHQRKFELMHGPFLQQRRNNEQEIEKTPFLVVQKIQDAILDETFKPGERLPEAGLGEMFKVSRSPVREALFALESQGTVIMESYKGAILKPLSPEEALDIAELRLALISLAAKPAYRYLSPADFDSAYGLAKQITRSDSAKEHFEYNRQFWDIILEKTQRPILREVFRGLEDRSIRYVPLILKLFPDPAKRPRQREVLIEFYRKGKVDEALRAFKKIYLVVVQQIIDHLKTEDAG
jgi:DNA-binding GntR family transcriptional regulator